MKIKSTNTTVDEIENGDVFQYDRHYWIKTDSSNEESGFQCVELSHGTLKYIAKGTKVSEVNAELRLNSGK
jgi:hypothetical protein